MKELTRVEKVNILLGLDSVVDKMGYRVEMRREYASANRYYLCEMKGEGEEGNILCSGAYFMMIKEAFAILLEVGYFDKEIYGR